jgi:hypothetical protein
MGAWLSGLAGLNGAFDVALSVLIMFDHNNAKLIIPSLGKTSTNTLDKRLLGWLVMMLGICRMRFAGNPDVTSAALDASWSYLVEGLFLAMETVVHGTAQAKGLLVVMAAMWASTLNRANRNAAKDKLLLAGPGACLVAAQAAPGAAAASVGAVPSCGLADDTLLRPLWRASDLELTFKQLAPGTLRVSYSTNPESGKWTDLMTVSASDAASGCVAFSDPCAAGTRPYFRLSSPGLDGGGQSSHPLTVCDRVIPLKGKVSSLSLSLSLSPYSLFALN